MSVPVDKDYKSEYTMHLYLKLSDNFNVLYTIAYRLNKINVKFKNLFFNEKIN